MADKIIVGLELRGNAKSLRAALESGLSSLKKFNTELSKFKKDFQSLGQRGGSGFNTRVGTEIKAIKSVEKAHTQAEAKKRSEIKKTEQQATQTAARTKKSNDAVLRSLFSPTGSALGGGRSFGERFAVALGIGAGATGVFLAVRSFNTELKDLVNTAAEFQRLGTSFVSILAQARVAAQGGRALSGEDLRALGIESQRLFREAQISAIQTVATTKEYVQVLQTALAVGQQVGLSQGEVEKITKRLVLAAGAFGIEFNQLGSSVAQILSGTVRVTNQLGRNLGLATAEQRKQLKLAIEQGRLFTFLDQRTKAFGQTAKDVANNFINVRAAVQDIFEVGGAQAIAPLFKFLNDELIKFRDRFIGDDENQILKPALENIVRGFQNFFAGIIPDLKQILFDTKNLITAIGNLLSGAGGTGVKVLLQTFSAILRVLTQIISAKGFGGIILIIAGLNAGLSFVIGRMRAIALLSLQYKRNMEQANLAAARGGFSGGLAKQTAVLSIASRALGIIGTVAAVAALGFELLGDDAEKAAKAVEKVHKNLTGIDEEFAKFAANASGIGLVQEFQELTKIPIKERTTDQIQRLNEITVLLAENFRNVGSAFDDSTKQIVSGGRLTQNVIDALTDRTTRQAKEVTSQVDNLRELSKALQEFQQLSDKRSGLSGASRFLPVVSGGTGNENFEAEEARFESLKKKIELLGNANQIATKDAINHRDALVELQQGVETQISAREKLLESLQREQVSLEGTISRIGFKAQLLDELQARVKEGIADSQQEAEALALVKQLQQEQAILLTDLINKARIQGQQSNRTTQQVLEDEKKKLESLLKLTSVQELNNALTRQAAELALAKAKADLEAALQTDDTTAKLEAQNRVLALNQALQGTDPEEFRKNLERQIAAFNSAIGTIRIGRATGGSGKSKFGRQRDELSDFLKEIDRQLGLLKTLSELISKETDRITDSRRKAIRELGIAGEIPFEEALRREAELITRANIINQKLNDAQSKFIKSNSELVDAVAKRQQGKDNKDKVGSDLRDRELEALERKNKQNLEVLQAISAEARKVEEELTELTRFGVEQRISIRQGELEFQREFIKLTADSAARVKQVQAQLGLATSEEAIAAEFEAGRTEREQRRKEIFQALVPFADPEFKKEFDAALEAFGADTKQDIITFLKNQTADDLAALEQRTRQATELIKVINGINRSLAAPDRNKKGDRKLIEERAKFEAQLQEISQDIAAQTGDNLSSRQIVGLQAVLALISKLEGTREEKLKRITELFALEKEDAEALYELTLKQRDAELERLELHQKITSFELERLDLFESLIDLQREFGTLTEAQAQRERFNLVQRRLEQTKILRDQLKSQLQRESANLQGRPTDNPQVAARQLELTGRINELNVRLFELQNRAFELRSPLFAAAQGFREVGDAIGQIEGPVGKLAPLFTGLARIADTLANRKRPNLEESLSTAARGFEDAGKDFNFQIKDSSQIWINGVQTTVGLLDKFVQETVLLSATRPRTVSGGGGGNRGILADIIEDGLGDLDPADINGSIEKAKKSVTFGLGEFIGRAASIAADLIGSISSGDRGAIVSSIGRSISQFNFPGSKIIGGIVESVGGIISFFGARAKQKTKEMAEAITEGIDKLKREISRGTISLGRGIRELQRELESARRRLSGRKGGREELERIEDDLNDEIERLRDQAREIQKSFREELKLLRQPKELRDVITQIKEISKRAKEFINSFENPEDALQAIEQATEFVRRSIQEIKDEIEKNLKSLQDQMKESSENFAKSQRDILLEGRLSPQVSVAESKRARLIELEREFRRQQQELRDQIAAEQKKLDFVNDRFKIEQQIARLARQSAEQLGLAADRLANAANSIERVFGGLNRLPFGAGTQSQFVGGPTAITLDLRLNGQSIGKQTVGIPATRHLTLRGDLSPSKLPKFNPKTRIA
jgi:hypothetical protein